MKQEFFQTLSNFFENPSDRSADAGSMSDERPLIPTDPSPQLKDIFKKIEENSRVFREPSGKAALVSQNVDVENLSKSPLFQGTKTNQRISDQLGEIRDLITNSQEMSQRLAGLIEALSEQARLQAAERIELDRERDQINSWRNREQLSLNRRATRWARFAFIVSLVGLIVGFLRPVLQPVQTAPAAPAVVSADLSELKPTLDRIEGRLSRIERAKPSVVRPKSSRRKYRKRR